MIEFSKDRFSVYSQRNLEIPLGYKFLPSNIYGLFGANAIGKTTLLNQILKDLNSTSPLITKSTYSEIKAPRKDIAIIPQKIEELLLPWLTPSEITKVFNKNYSQNSGKSNFLENTQKKHQFKTMSGGEKQTFAIDLITSFNFKVLFFDEPLSSLDFENTSLNLIKIKEYIKSEKALLFIVLHDFTSLQYISDYIMFFNHSKNIIYIEKNPYPISDDFLSNRKIDTRFIELCLEKTR